MTWLIALGLSLAVGGLRFIDGSSLQYPRFVSTALIAGLTGLTAWVASSNWITSVIVGICSAWTIQMGDTLWGNLRHQIIRGFYPCAFMIILLLCSGWLWSNLSGLLIIVLHIIAFAVYFGVDKITPPFGHFEQWCRVMQGFSICGAASLV